MIFSDMTILELASALRRRECSSRELTLSVLQNAEQNEKEIGAYITMAPDAALLQADQADGKLASGDGIDLLTGIPMALKDNIATRGIRTTNASRMMEHFVPPYDAFVWEILRDKNAVLVGKTNLDEFAMGGSTEMSAFHLTRNPYDTRRVPGGSSGGSAAAVASGEAVYALGTDTGGSVRQPASYCGLVGMRPTYGRVSRNGVTSFASSFDQAGPVTRSVRGNAAVLDALSIYDRHDVMAENRPHTSFVQAADNPFGTPVIGYYRDIASCASAEISAAQEKVLRFYESIGARTVPIDLPILENALAAYYLLTSAEGYSAINRFDGIHFGYRSDSADSADSIYVKSRSEALGLEVKCRVLLGSYLLSREHYTDYFEKAARVRTLVIRSFASLFETCDVILSPVTPTTAPLIGTRQQASADDRQYNDDRFTVPASLAGLPALAFPACLSENGLPIGVQLTGPRFTEGMLYRIAAAYEDAHGLLPRPGLLSEKRNG